MVDGLNLQNYVNWFQTMLWVEEMQMEIDINFYSTPDAILKKVPPQKYNTVEVVELEVGVV